MPPPSPPPGLPDNPSISPEVRRLIMDSSSIDLTQSRIAGLRVDDHTVAVRFAPAIIIKTMTGSVERTKWRQDGELVFTDAELDDEALPPLPADCTGGDVGENVYTYRDMVPVPLTSQGRAHCVLKIAGSDRLIRIQGGGVHLAMDDVPKYLEHLRD